MICQKFNFFKYNLKVYHLAIRILKSLVGGEGNPTFLGRSKRKFRPQDGFHYRSFSKPTGSVPEYRGNE